MVFFTGFRHAIAMAVVAILLQPVTALASDSASESGLSALVGFNTHYVHRGVPLAHSAAFVGLDYENSGVYLETWVTEVETGLQAEFLAGYSGEAGEWTYSAGATGYYFTDDFEDTYLELNLSGGWQYFTLDVTIGQYDNFAGPTEDYTFISAKVEYNDFYGLFGTFGRDRDGDYLEVGYSNSLSVGHTELFDYSVSIIRSSEELAENEHGGVHEPDTFLNFNITRHFSL